MKDSLKVLVIDDSPFILKAVKRAIEPHGFEVVGYAENGKLGVEMYEEHIPDIITLDMTMPVMDGLETASHLFKKNPNAKIIMLSAMGDETLIQNAKSIGIKHFLSKPFKPDKLLDTISDLIDEEGLVYGRK